MENVSVFYGHFWYILMTFGKVRGNLATLATPTVIDNT
jgi:hypothetical protein